MPQDVPVRIGVEGGTGNFWIDTGLVVLAQCFGEGEYSADDILRRLVGMLTQKTGNKGLYYDRKARQLREYEKTNWSYPFNLFNKVTGGPGKKVTINGNAYPIQPPIFQLKLELSNKPATCDICGEHRPVTKAKMWMFPFLVDPSKFANFYSGLKRGAQLCARCALAGLAAYLGWLWKAQGQDALHFFIFHSALDHLERLHRTVLGPLRVQGGRGGNAQVAFSGPYLHETALGLLLQLFSLAHSSDVLSEKERQVLAEFFRATAAAPPPVTLYAISGKGGQAFRMTNLREFSRLHDLFGLYERWLKALSKIDNNPHERLVMVFRQFQIQQDKQWESLWRDRVAWAVLTFDDPFPFVEQFLYEVQAREENPRPLVRGTMEVLEQYAQEVMCMNEQFQKTLAGFGHNLGSEAYEHNETGLLYDLRNAKNPEAFYRVLNNVQFRLGATIPEPLLRIEKGERIAGVPWVRVKTILAIYAMNAFLREEEQARKKSDRSGQSQAKEEE